MFLCFLTGVAGDVHGHCRAIENRAIHEPRSEAVLICMDMYSRHFFLLLRRRFHREVIFAASAFGSTG
jgi:hypothetical protein